MSKPELADVVSGTY